MSRHALVQNGEIIGYRDYAPVGDQSKLAPGKPRQLPVVEVNAEYDPASQVREGPAVTIQAKKVVLTYTVRNKNDAELDAMRAEKFAEIEAAFQSRVQAPISFDVGGEIYTFHADQEAITNISGVLQAYTEAERIGLDPPLPDPRRWTPKGSTSPITISRAQLALLGLAIAQRKDALFVIKKQKQAAVNAMTSGTEIEAYDTSEAWA